MLDIKSVVENPEKFQKAANEKNIDIDINYLIEIYQQRNNIQKQLDDLRQQRKEIAKQMQTQRTDEKIEQGKQLKQQIIEKEKQYNELQEKFMELMVKIPTIHAEDTPIGKDDSENVEVKTWGNIPKFDFEPKDHIQLGKICDIIDFDQGAKVAGYRGYYIKNEGVLLMMGFLMWGLQKVSQKGFKPMIPPTLVKEFCLFGTGYFSGKEYDSSVDEIYQISNRDKTSSGEENKEKKFLVGTSEPSLLAYYSDKVLEEKDLPLKHSGYSQCYRSEIGSYGKDTQGMYRVHEFMKIEQVVLCKADIQESDNMQQTMLTINEELYQELGLPYRVLRMCSGDMGAGKYKMYDMETWMPGTKRYAEVASASNFLDWQSRRLNVKYKTKDGDMKYVYMLNDTVLPSPRIFITILENYQQADGSIVVPQVLREFVGINVIKAKK